MSTCLQLRKHTSTPHSTLSDWDLAGSQPLENGSRIVPQKEIRREANEDLRGH